MSLPVLSEAVAVIKFAIEHGMPESRKEQKALRSRFDEATSQAIARHHTYVVSWCEQFHTLEGVRDPRADTVALAFDTQPRRLMYRSEDPEVVEESDLLYGDQHVAVTGDPGAGKTTTMRRIASQVALTPEARADDDFAFVLLVVCREERWDDDRGLLEVLSEKVGLAGKIASELDDPQGWLLDLVDCYSLILIDGLDEVGGAQRGQLRSAIEKLGRYLRRSRVVVSCRSADFRPIEQFTEAEILPLDGHQIQAAASAVLGPDEASHFLEAIDRPGHPARDLATRPLFLNQMTVIYHRRGTIPERPSDLCRSLIQLVLRDWDEQRGIRRVSAYSKFDVYEKERFLADLALELTMRGTVWFLASTLEQVYKNLAPRFDLPEREAVEVAGELESHTGLFVRRGRGFEFSHLSLQEYLAADSMIRSGGSGLLEWWEFSPAVTAVAVALSSTPSDWLTDRLSAVPNEIEDVRPYHSFLHRMADERPGFTKSEQLGEELLRLFFRARISSRDLAEQLHDLNGLRASVREAMRHRQVRTANNRTMVSSRTSDGPVVGVDSDFLRILLGPDLYTQTLKEARPPRR